jgi:hypothetical protein
MALRHMTITKYNIKMEAPPHCRRCRRAWKVFLIFFELSYDLISHILHSHYYEKYK